MTNTSRHQAGATVAGEKTGGQFKASERTSADGGALSRPEERENAGKRILASAARLRELDKRERELQHERETESLRYAGLVVLAEHPDAVDLVLGVSDDPDESWSLAGVRNQDGDFIELRDGLMEEVDGCFLAEGYKPAAGEALDFGDNHGVGDDWPYADTVSILDVAQDPEPKSGIDLDVYERDSDGRLTTRARADALDDIEVEMYRAALRVKRFQIAEDEGLNTAEDHDAWNATHDLRTELNALHAAVMINRGHVVVGSSEWLAMNNID